MKLINTGMNPGTRHQIPRAWRDKGVTTPTKYIIQVRTENSHRNNFRKVYNTKTGDYAYVDGKEVHFLSKERFNHLLSKIE